MNSQKTTFAVVAIILAFICGLANAQSSPALSFERELDRDDNTSQADRIRQLILELKSPEYETRVNASRILASLGKSVIQPLFRAIRSDDIETSFRAIKIIKDVGLNSDLDTLEIIITRSSGLPEAYRTQFDQWSARAITAWKANQSRVAVKKLTQNGASVVRIDDLGQLGLMLIEDLEQDLKPLKSKTTTKTETDIKEVLHQIRDLKKELAGELVAKKPKPREPEVRNQFERIDLGEHRIVIRGGGGRLVTPSTVPRENPQNVVFGADWKGSPGDLNDLRFVTNLNRVEFVEKEITPEILSELTKIRGLRSLLLTRCKFSFSNLQKFKVERDRYQPLELMATGAGYLGVYGPNAGEPDDGKGSYVSLVSPNSAASEAGLERGDLIVGVDEDAIRTFADLSLVISSKPIGQEIKIAIRRDNQEKVLTAKLKSRAGLR